METLISNKLLQFVADLGPSKLQVPQSLHAAAQAYLLGQDFPTTKAERFKYTRLAKLANAQLSAAHQLDAAQLEQHCILTDAYTIYVNNDQITIPQNLPVGLEINLNTQVSGTFHEASFYDIFGALNILHAQNGVSIALAKNCTLDKPIQIVPVPYVASRVNFGTFSKDAYEKSKKSVEPLSNFCPK